MGRLNAAKKLAFTTTLIACSCAKSETRTGLKFGVVILKVAGSIRGDEVVMVEVFMGTALKNLFVCRQHYPNPEQSKTFVFGLFSFSSCQMNSLYL